MAPKRHETSKVQKNLEACTDEELLQRLAVVLANASGEVLKDNEVHNFYKLCQELRRADRFPPPVSVEPSDSSEL